MGPDGERKASTRFLSTYRAVASVPLQKGAAALRASPSIRDFFIFMASSARSLAVCRLLTAATLLYEATAGLDPHSARSFLSDAGLWTHLATRLRQVQTAVGPPFSLRVATSSLCHPFAIQYCAHGVHRGPPSHTQVPLHTCSGRRAVPV